MSCARSWRRTPRRREASLTDPPVRARIRALWRAESPKLLASLARRLGDVGLAEDCLQDALVEALARWPEAGVPPQPAAWLLTTAKNRAIDGFRRAAILESKHDELGRDFAARELLMPDYDAALDAAIPDDLLRLVFVACHPALPPEGRVALTLRMLGGLTTDEIARAFLTPEATVAQRIVRAKRTLAEKRVPFEVPTASELPERLGAVLAVLYLVFNEGYAASHGDDWMRPTLCAEALRLGRLLPDLVPGAPEIHGLLALMELQASRFQARTGPTGQPVLLLEQDRTRWDHAAIARGLADLARAEALGGAAGPYALQAAIAACHARALDPTETDWARIAGLYDRLARVSPSPVVELNRAVAHAQAHGPAAGLALADLLLHEPRLAGYHLLPAVRGDFLAKLGRFSEARAAFEAAAGLTRNAAERRLMLDRAAEGPPT